MIDHLCGRKILINHWGRNGMVLEATRRAPGADNVAGNVAARLERLPFSMWHVKARVLIGTATFFDAFDALAIAQVLPALVPLWKLTGPEVGLLISIGYIGQLVGALLFGWMAERYGRLPAMAAAIATFSIASFACALSWNYESLLVSRTIQGLGLGGQVPIAAVYISEIAKAEGRGRFVLLYENVFSVGVVVASLVGSVIVPAYGWQAMFAIGGIPVVLALIVPRALPESPRWLASRGRSAEAEAAVAEIEEKTKRYTGKPLPAVGPDIAASVKKASWADLVGGIYLRRSLVVWTIWFSAYVVYYSLNIWLPTLYRTMFNVPLDQALRLGVITSVCALAGTLTSAFTADWLGRRLLFTLSLGGAGLCMTILWWLGASTLMQVVVLGGAACYFAGIAVLTVYVYTPELYPTRARALATSIGSAFLRLGSIVGPVIVGMTISSGVAFACLVFALIAFAAALVAAAFAIETKGKSLEALSP